VPALAVADALRAEARARVVFIGGERAEAQLVPEAGYELRQVQVAGLSRTDPVKAARAGVRAVGAVGACARLLGELRPAAVLGGGGYVAGVAGAAAVARRVPLVLTEADSHMGIANRLLSPFARRICLAFPIAGRDGERYRVTGRPVPGARADRHAARTRFGIGDDETCVLVFGGSLGARSVNEAAVAGLAGAPYRVLHAAGRRDHAALADALGPEPPANYLLHDYITPFGDALAAADLVVARAGGSIFEVASYARPAILVPYPHAAGDHQAANARWMAEAGAAVVIADGELSAQRLRREVDALLADPTRLLAMGAASGALARPYAARDIAREVLRAAGASA